MNDGAEVLLGFLVEIGNGNASSEDRIVRMSRREICCSFTGQIVEFDCSHAIVNARDDFLCNPVQKP